MMNSCQLAVSQLRKNFPNYRASVPGIKSYLRFFANFFGAVRQPEMVRIARLVHAELANFPDLTRFYFEAVILRNRSLLDQILQRGAATGEFRVVPHDFVLRAVPSLLVHYADAWVLSSGTTP